MVTGVPKLFQSWLHSHPTMRIVVGCVLVLLFAQLVVSGMSAMTLYRYSAETTAERAELKVRFTATAIENGLKFGKPLGHYHDLNVLLDHALTTTGGASGVLVVMANGRQVTGIGQPIAEAPGLLEALTSGDSKLARNLIRRPQGSIVALSNDRVVVAVPLTGGGHKLIGAVMLAVTPDQTGVRQSASDGLAVSLWITLAAGIVLATVFRYVIPIFWVHQGRRGFFLITLVALVLAQGIFTLYQVTAARETFERVTRDHVRLLSFNLQRDLGHVAGLGIPLKSMRNVEGRLARLVAAYPFIDSVEITDSSGHVIRKFDARTAERTGQASAETGKLVTSVAFGSGTANQGYLNIRVSDTHIREGVKLRIFDGLTVMVVALVMAIETLLLLTLRLQGPYFIADGGPEIGRFARSIMCGFLFAYALPISFLPLFVRSLPDGGLGFAPGILLALPVIVEMACGLIAALIAGKLTDQYGWHVATLSGILILVAGFVLCTLAPNLVWFVFARAVVGAGYGLTWMGLQGFIVTRSTPAYRGFNMASGAAGLFAGQLSGAAIGALLMEQLGARSVFAVGAASMLLPLTGLVVLMHQYISRPHARAVQLGRIFEGANAVLRLVLSKNVGLLLVGSVIPFSIAQVGLLSFGLPLYLETAGATVTESSRVLMIYGLCIIYLGPIIGRRADRYGSQKQWITAAGVLGSLGLLNMHWHQGLVPAALAVLALAIAGCLTGATYAPFLLSMPEVQRYGVMGSVSIMRAADKLGQMAGPMLLGMMYGTLVMGSGLAVLGMIYLTGTLLFMTFARGDILLTRKVGR